MPHTHYVRVFVRNGAFHSLSSIHAAWIASRIFSFDLWASSSKSGSAITHLCRSVNRRFTLSASGWASSSSMAMSCTSVQRSLRAISRPSLLVDHHVAGCGRQLDDQAIELVGHADLAAEPR